MARSEVDGVAILSSTLPSSTPDTDNSAGRSDLPVTPDSVRTAGHNCSSDGNLAFLVVKSQDASVECMRAAAARSRGTKGRADLVTA